jgi:hypothetical protein
LGVIRFQPQRESAMSEPQPPAGIVIEALVDFTNYETGDVYAVGDQFTTDDPLLANTIVGINFGRVVDAAEPPPDPGDVTRRRRGRPPHVNPRPPHDRPGHPSTGPVLPPHVDHHR